MSQLENPESDDSWEEHSIDEEVVNSSDYDSSSDDISSPEEEDEVENDEEYEVRGAEPYRFEPMPSACVATCTAQ